KKWVGEQNRHTRKYLDSIRTRPVIERRLRELYTARPASYSNPVERGGRLFALKNQPPKEQVLLVTLASVDDPGSERVLLDPMTLASDASISIDWFVPSVDGRIVAVSLSRGGSERGDLHFYDVATGKPLADMIPRVNYGTALGSAAWNADGSGIYYTRYPREGERPAKDLDFYQQVFFHKLGTPEADDRYEIGKDLPRIAENFLYNSDDGRWLLLSAKNGDGGDVAHYIRAEDGTWKQVTSFSDPVPFAVIGGDEHLYLLSRKLSPMGAIVRVPLARPELASAETVVPPGDGAIDSFVVTPGHLFATYQIGGPSELRAFALDGTSKGNVPVLPVSAVRGVVPLAGGAVLFNNSSFLQPGTWYVYDAVTARTRSVAWNVPVPVNFEDSEVERVMVASKDGTKVPLNIIRRKGTRLDGTNPVLLTGYGGYGSSMTPGFSARRRLWLDVGGVWAVANIRGGGEFGEAWHEQGNLTRKQNVFDDFAACARYLVDQKYTTPSKLVIEGGSNGGLLMGAALTQHPDLFRVVVSHVGLYDMLRVELSPNGEFNVTEFGTVRNRDQFNALYAYSPYHRVKKGTRYPAVLMLTGDNDPRVDPMHSRKMIARLQAASTSTHPILLRTSSSTGHGGGTALSTLITMDADVWAFVFDQLGIEYK
ncbi:MAG TPA: prolyl oligopeptidase family serine peptidase, partial [Thermoanaerobaculia bacterium]|nr:prolyl oligopeptidase family serine peptidase [Thermoanaerobaculia bacterium]